jgi:hypothetical protein
LSWEKEFFDESSVKRSILTIFVATKDQKRLKVTLAIYLDLFSGLGAIFRDLGYILSLSLSYMFILLRAIHQMFINEAAYAE